MNEQEFINRVNARLRGMQIKPPCHVCGSPSAAVVIVDGQTYRVCFECSLLLAEGRYVAGYNVLVGIEGCSTVLLGVHPNEK